MTSFPGYLVIDDYIDETAAAKILSSIETYVASHDVPIIHRHHARRELRYSVIDGLHVRQHLPALEGLYAEVNARVNELLGVDVVPLRDPMASLNVNITPPGGSYRWHYDRNAFTATLYLNRVAGGDLEVCPNYRLGAGRGRTGLTRFTDRLLQTPAAIRAFGHKVSVPPRPGVLVLMRGNRCLHSVSQVTGTANRVNVVMAFDDIDGVSRIGDELDTYLYSQEQVRSTDPNYRTG